MKKVMLFIGVVLMPFVAQAVDVVDATQQQCEERENKKVEKAVQGIINSFHESKEDIQVAFFDTISAAAKPIATAFFMLRDIVLSNKDVRALMNIAEAKGQQIDQQVFSMSMQKKVLSAARKMIAHYSLLLQAVEEGSNSDVYEETQKIEAIMISFVQDIINEVSLALLGKDFAEAKRELNIAFDAESVIKTTADLYKAGIEEGVKEAWLESSNASKSAVMVYIEN